MVTHTASSGSDELDDEKDDVSTQLHGKEALKKGRQCCIISINDTSPRFAIVGLVRQ